MSSFDTRPTYNAEASHFIAKIKAGLYKWTADITWKEANKFAAPLSFNAQSRTTGKYAGAKVIHATSEDALRAQLRQLDPSVKFVVEPNKSTALGTPITMSDSDAKMLEEMRVDPDVSDIVYNRACRQFGTPPQKRPDFTVAPAVVEKSLPYSETEIGELNHTFLQIFLRQHPELVEAGHGPYNTDVLLSYHRDSGLSVLTLASLDRAFQECQALHFFRTVLSGTRTRGQSDTNVVRSYSFDAVQAYRRSDEEPPAPAPPPPGSPQEAAENARVLRLAKNQVRQLHPSWNEKSGEFNRSVTEVVRSWAISENPNLAKKSGHF
jgi:hypothetical protein